MAGSQAAIAADVRYASQQRSTKGRSRLQAARLRLFLSDMPDSTKPPAKQPLMFRRTYAQTKADHQTTHHKVLRPITAYGSQRHAIV